LKNVYAMALSQLVDDSNPDDDTIPAWIEWINRKIRDGAKRFNTGAAGFTRESYSIALRQISSSNTVKSARPWLTRFEAMLYRDNALATEIRQEYGNFISTFSQESLPYYRFKNWSEFFLKLYFRIIDYGGLSIQFRRYTQNVSGGALLAHTQYANVLYEFDAGRLSHDDLVDRSADFLDGVSHYSDGEPHAVVEIVVNELQHVDADLDTVLPAIRQRLRSEHRNYYMADQWHTHLADEWPE
jgi:hypothetical protein